MDREQCVNLCLQIEPGANRKMQRDYVEALMDLCAMADPHIAIDIGTNSGTSAMAALCAMFVMGKFNFGAYTIDIRQHLYRATMERMEQQFHEIGIPMSKTVIVEQDFKQLDPDDYLSPTGAPVFCFYDIHDLDDGSDAAASPRFIESWLPKMRKAIIAVHDINPCDEEWKRPAHWGTVPSAAKVQLWDGRWFRGFGEVEHFVNYFNEHRVCPMVIDGTSLIYFAVVEGMPVSA